VEFLTRFSEFRHRELLWRSVGDGTTRKLFLATIEKSRFHTASPISRHSSARCTAKARTVAVRVTCKFLLQQMAAVAELEARMISARTKAVLAAARRQRGDGRSF